MNYPVTTPFGQVPGYPLNNGFHNGIDYGYPMGTPVVVNGVTIGLSNNTGSTTGPHLHIGKYIEGIVQNPGVGNGFVFNSAVVFDTGFDNTDGNYVRITGDGALWNYLHLEKVLVTKGQVLKGDEMTGTDENLLANYFHYLLGREPDLPSKKFIGQPADVVFNAITGSDEYKARQASLASGYTPYSGPQLYTKA